MNATKLTMIVFSVTAIIISGCSRDNRVTSPGGDVYPDIDKNQAELTIQPETENNAARIAVRGDESVNESIYIVAEVHKTNFEKGCWYLKSNDGEYYTPMVPKSLELELGMKLKASGYVDKSIHFFCGNGPAFVIEEYAILTGSDEPTEDRAPAKPVEDRAHKASAGIQSSEQATAALTADKALRKKKDTEVKSAPTEDRALQASTGIQSSEQAAAALTADNAPRKKKDKEIKSASTKDRALQASAGIQSSEQVAAALTADNAPRKKKDIEVKSALTEDRAPQSDWPSEDEAPYNKKAKEVQDAITEDRAPQSEWPSEDEAPQKYEENESDPMDEVEMLRPVPIIFDDMELSAGQNGNTLEGYVRHTKDGCLLLETTQKEVFEIQHDMDYDILLADGTYILVTGYISTLPYMVCADAPVFHAETIRILMPPKESIHPVNDQDVPSEDAFSAELLEAEGVMGRTKPEGMCWYFETDDGERFELLFSDPISLNSGLRLKIEGKHAQVSTFCESGKPIEVVRWETVSKNKF